MFTGIIETLGEVIGIEQQGSNFHFTLQTPISKTLKVDQSVAHNGVCLTVVEQEADWHRVTAVEETLLRSNLDKLQLGDQVNIERAMLASHRLDGHIVQGHVDGKGYCRHVQEADGSWYFRFQYIPKPEHLVVDKGSICINGVSLTVVEPADDQFSVAIIPYTFHHTNFQFLKPGDSVNFEFDILGKYIARHVALYR